MGSGRHAGGAPGRARESRSAKERAGGSTSRGGWGYRAGQFLRAVLGRVSRADMQEALSVLGPDLYAMFAALPAQYRHHMMAVYRRVRASGCDDRDILRGALLHDAGKYDPASGHYVSIPYRVAVVLLEVVPSGKRLLSRLAAQGGAGREGGAARTIGKKGLLYPFYLSEHHAALGAEMAREHGASGRVVSLVANHHRHGTGDSGVAILQAADDRS